MNFNNFEGKVQSYRNSFIKMKDLHKICTNPAIHGRALENRLFIGNCRKLTIETDFLFESWEKIGRDISIPQS